MKENIYVTVDIYERRLGPRKKNRYNVLIISFLREKISLLRVYYLFITRKDLGITRKNLFKMARFSHLFYSFYEKCTNYCNVFIIHIPSIMIV